MRALALLAAGSAFALAALPAHAGSDASLDQDYIGFEAGYFDVLHHDDDTALQVGAEYRFHQWDFGIRPVVAVSTNWDGMFYAGGGIEWDVPLPVFENRLYLTPGVLAGYYHQGGSRDLGGPIEFRDSIELSYRFDNEQRAGIRFQHMSNASLYNHNPGVESLMATYAIPIGSFR